MENSDCIKTRPIQLQQSADSLFVATAETFAKSLPGDIDYLAERILFLVDPAGVEIGTITAWNDNHFHGRDIGHIHWVAISSTAQGRGLAKPMLSAACELLQKRGYTEAYLKTNTRRLPAINLYLQFRFVPQSRDAIQYNAWQAIALQLKYPIEI